MKQRLILIVLMSILLGPGAVAVPAPERSVSPSRQFIIYGANTRLRAAISELAETTKANLLALIRQPDRWTTPVIVNLQLPQTTRPELPPAAPPADPPLPAELCTPIRTLHAPDVRLSVHSSGRGSAGGQAEGFDPGDR